MQINIYYSSVIGTTYNLALFCCTTNESNIINKVKIIVELSIMIILISGQFPKKYFKKYT